MLKGQAFPKAKGLGFPLCLLLMAAIWLVAGLIGCSDSALLSENSGTVEEGTGFFDQPFDENTLSKPGDIFIDDVVVVEQFLAVDEGGVIIFSEVDNLETAEAFIVQPYSFLDDTSFVVEVTKIITIDGELPIIYDFGPDGLEFTKTAFLRINAWEDFGKKCTEVTLYWLNEATQRWEKQGSCTVDPVTGNVVFGLDHFSKYGSNNSTPKGKPSK